MGGQCSYCSKVPNETLQRLDAAGSSRRHLVINMDVNKTIVMSDKVSGKTAWDVVNEALASVSWGVAIDDQTWRLHEAVPSSTRPEPTADAQKLQTYQEWNEKRMPGSKKKKERQKLNSTFTERGQPGESMRHLAHKAVQELKNPDGTDVGILPSFFELMLFLKRDKRSFMLFFRTFGEDLADVADELNEFCEGRHPQFPGIRMDGSDGEPDYRLSMSSTRKCGTFHRDENCTSLVMGTTEQPGEGRFKNATNRTLQFFDQFSGLTIISGIDKVQDALCERFKQCGTIGLRDYFAYWKSKDPNLQCPAVFQDT